MREYPQPPGSFKKTADWYLLWDQRKGDFKKCGELSPPFQLLYDGPYAVLRRGPRSFTIRVGSRDKVVAVNCLKACTAADAKPGSPCRSGRPPGLLPGGLTATKRVSFSDPLVSLPSPSLVPPRGGPRTIFLPSEEVFAHPGLAVPLQTTSTDAVPALSAGTAQEVGPLASSPPSWGQSSGGALWRAVYAPGDGQTSPAYSSQSVLCLYINHLLSFNKLVLSYLLLRLLPQKHTFRRRRSNLFAPSVRKKLI